MAAQLNSFISYRYKWGSLEFCLFSTKRNSDRGEAWEAKSKPGPGEPGWSCRAPSSACSEPFPQLSPAESCSPWNGPCPLLNQITAEQTANCKTQSIWGSFSASLPRAQDSEITSQRAPWVSKRGKLRHRRPAGIWGDPEGNLCPRWGLPSSKGSLQAKICPLCPQGTEAAKAPHTLTPNATSSGHKEITAKKYPINECVEGCSLT